MKKSNSIEAEINEYPQFPPSGYPTHKMPDAPSSSYPYGTRRAINLENPPPQTELDPLSRLNTFRIKGGNPDTIRT